MLPIKRTLDPVNSFLANLNLLKVLPKSPDCHEARFEPWLILENLIISQNSTDKKNLNPITSSWPH